MKKASLIGFAVFFMMAGQVFAAWWWPPTGGTVIVPQNPTSHDVVHITLWGEWPNSCTPNASGISVVGNNIYFDVFAAPPSGCLTVLTPWQRTQSAGPLSEGTYTVYARLRGDPYVPETYTPVADFIVTASIYYVDTVNGDDNNDGLSPQTAFATIQAGIDAAKDGDTVIVQPGTYYENIAMKDGVTVQGSGADVTTIDGGGNGHVVVFNLASGTISGFTMTNSGNHLGGIFTSQCTVRIENNVVVNNHRGIILSSNSTAVIIGNRIMNNTGVFGSGIEVSSSSATIANNIIAHNDGWAGIDCTNSSPSIIKNTITGNEHYGIRCNPISTQVIANNIITHNEYGIMAHGGGESPVPLLHISYNDVWNNSEANYWEEYGVIIIPDGGWVVSQPFEPIPGTGEISQAPRFADGNNSDYHLKSEAGRWELASESWVADEVTSPCIDAGNPGCPVGDEPEPNGNRINMGAYGGTAEASKSPANWALLADLTNDGIVDFVDLAVFFGYWPDSGQCVPADLNRSGSVDLLDYSILANQWPDAIVAEPQIQYEIAPCDLAAASFFAAEESGETRFTVTVEGRYIHFEDMMRANCCATALWLGMTVEDNLITIYEGEYATFPCFCICDYPVTATLGPFEEGTYLLEVYEDWGGFIGSTIVTIGPGG